MKDRAFDLLKYAAVTIAGLSLVVSLVALLHGVSEPGNFHTRIHELEVWVDGVAFPTAITILAAAGVVYLARKS